MNDFQDKTLVCRDCGKEFTFTASEQEFYAAKGFTNPPSRCPECRAKAKQARQQGGGFGSRRSFGDRGPREMHEATCAECGEKTMVPFVPRGDRPIYCDACFAKRRQSQYRDRPAA